ncbi:MAG TPA: argininosuccinate lyase, partial [Firmicutes bacterium]|nr:argininosuccinate lyase [Bacillota bacterium]
MEYLWEGRLGKKLNEKVKKFTYSIDIDRKLALYDIKGSIVHAEMLGRCGIIRKKESETLIRGLKDIKREIEEGKFVFKSTDEDIHTAIERRLIEITGKVGEKIHTARSRNDQIVLDEKMYLKDAIGEVIFLITKFQNSLLILSEKVFPHIFSGYTHLQQSQPLLLSHYFLAHIEMMERDKERFKDSLKRVDVLPL